MLPDQFTGITILQIFCYLLRRAKSIHYARPSAIYPIPVPAYFIPGILLCLLASPLITHS